MTWKSMSQELKSFKFGESSPATPEELVRIDLTLQAARHYAERSLPIVVIAREVTGLDIWVTRRHLSMTDARNAEFMALVDALVMFRAEERGDVVTHQGILLREDIDEALGREVVEEDGRRKIQFPIAIPWSRPPIIKDNGRVIDFGERGEPIYGKQQPVRQEKQAMKYWTPSLLHEKEE